MQHKEQLKIQLEEISRTIKNSYTQEKDIGILEGISGCALFQFYYSKYLNIDTQADYGIEMISTCIERINNGYTRPTYCNGIAGFGSVLQHLTSETLIDLDCDEFLSPFDDFLYQQMKDDLSIGFYDFLHGALGYGFYFFKRYKETLSENLRKRYSEYLLHLLRQLETTAIMEKEGLKWQSTLIIQNKANVGCNLSLSHGMSSIINFLCRLMDDNELKVLSKKLLTGAVNYIMSYYKNDRNNLSLFPMWIEANVSPKYNSRIAWCYGDLGIGISLLKASEVMGDSSLKNRALSILNQTMNRQKPEDTKVIDASICHGSYGNALIYSRLRCKGLNQDLDSIIRFWINDGVKKARHRNGYAGYKQWMGAEKIWEPKLSLLEGVSGIGLTIIDYLTNKPNNWNQYLLVD